MKVQQAAPTGAMPVGATFDRHDPSTGQRASTSPACRASDASAAANAAARAFAAWTATPPTDKRRILHATARLIDSHAAAIADIMRREIGATALWTQINRDLAIWHLDEAASLVTQMAGTAAISPDGMNFAFRDPVGVCLAIAPWNAPFVLGMRAVAVALACGNTVVLKASEMCPATHHLIGRLFAEAGLPEGGLTVISHAPEHAAEVVDALISHPAVRRVNFTGSTRVGRIVAETAARHLKRCLLELGGKAPFIVLADADLDAAAEAATFGAFLNQGQICMSTDRIIVLDAVADEFVGKLVARAARLTAGDPQLAHFPLGPLISPQVGQRLADLIADATARGAKILCGGPTTGRFMDATVVDHVSPGMVIYAEECFGPIAGICRVATEDEAISLANDTRYGLSAAIFSRDIGRALTLSRQIETGICHINSATVADRPDMPFGGVKDSGYGRFGGAAMLDEFTELRWVSVATHPRRYPF